MCPIGHIYSLWAPRQADLWENRGIGYSPWRKSPCYLQPAARITLFGALILSLVVHGTFFVSVILFGTRAMVIVVKPVQPERVAELAMSGGSHRITIVLPTEQTWACQETRCQR